MKKKRLPDLKTESEVHEFWSNHSLTDYLHEMKESDIKIVLSPELSRKIKERARLRIQKLKIEKKGKNSKAGDRT